MTESELRAQIAALTAWQEQAKIVLRGLWLRREYDRDHPVIIDLTQRAQDLSEP